MRAVECWRDLKKDDGISFGHALGKLFQETFVEVEAYTIGLESSR